MEIDPTSLPDLFKQLRDQNNRQTPQNKNQKTKFRKIIIKKKQQNHDYFHESVLLFFPMASHRRKRVWFLLIFDLFFCFVFRRVHFMFLKQATISKTSYKDAGVEPQGSFFISFYITFSQSRTEKVMKKRKETNCFQSNPQFSTKHV